MNDTNSRFEDLKGLVLTAINGAEQDSEEVVIQTSCGKRFILHHHQDCCEHVRLAEVIGDIKDLLGEPLIEAEEVSSEGSPPEPEPHDCWTWTFYKMGTKKGFVTMRWLGESNGYYSESVDFTRVS